MKPFPALLASSICVSLPGLAATNTPSDHADRDPANDDVVGPPTVIDDCTARLRAAKIEFASSEIPVHEDRTGVVCGAEQVLVYRRGPAGIRWNVSPVVTCGMALAIADFERDVAEEARVLGRRVVRIEQGGTYSCRRMARFQMVSEHSYANAIDVRAFVLQDGERVSVLRHFGKIDREPETAEARFLRALARRLYDDGVFSVVLTPFFDALHRDHFHLDLARYRVDGSRPAPL